MYIYTVSTQRSLYTAGYQPKQSVKCLIPTSCPTPQYLLCSTPSSPEHTSQHLSSFSVQRPSGHFILFSHPIVSRFIAQRANAGPGCSEMKTAHLSEFWKLDLKRKKKKKAKSSMLQEIKSILYVLKIICDHFYPMVILTD